MLLVPHEADARSATLWVGALDEPGLTTAALELRQVDGPIIGLGPAWDREVAGGGRQVAVRRVSVGGLEPRVRYRFELRRGGELVSDATLTTLPEAVPGLEDRPFTILLGSCFARQRDGGGSVGQAYAALPADGRPDLKILCGDQVYLDGFGLDTFVPVTSRDGLMARHLGTYAAAWTQDPGFRQLLRDGATMFTSDDHDFWNNAPNPSITAPQTYVRSIREAWWQVALALGDAFQPRPDPARRTVVVGDLTIHVPDTRRGRSEGTRTLLPDDELRAIEGWARTLPGPGCLVLGQVLFAGQTGWKGKFTDWGLPDFGDDYARIVKAVRSAPHAVVILTGDVHFGRVAVFRPASGVEIVEVVASPLSLIFPIPSHDWHAAPDRFPAHDIPGIVGDRVETETTYSLNVNHFATVELSRSGAFTRLRVRAWPVATNGAPPQPSHEFERWIA
jgi:hypothetical protein